MRVNVGEDQIPAPDLFTGAQGAVGLKPLAARQIGCRGGPVVPVFRVAPIHRTRVFIRRKGQHDAFVRHLDRVRRRSAGHGHGRSAGIKPPLVNHVAHGAEQDFAEGRQRPDGGRKDVGRTGSRCAVQPRAVQADAVAPAERRISATGHETHRGDVRNRPAPRQGVQLGMGAYRRPSLVSVVRPCDDAPSGTRKRRAGLDHPPAYRLDPGFAPADQVGVKIPALRLKRRAIAEDTRRDVERKQGHQAKPDTLISVLTPPVLSQ